MEQEEFTQALERLITPRYKRSIGKESRTTSLPVHRNYIVVIKGTIPPTGDKVDAAYLKSFEVLRAPVALTLLPDAAAIQALGESLRAEFPWAQDLVETVMMELMIRRRYGTTRLGFAPLLLVGHPGSGKTRFAQRLGELLGTPNTVINMAGMTDVKVLKGCARGWASNRPSRIVEFIQQSRAANPLFILDEVDKARHYGDRSGGDPQAALLDLLEPGNARRYQDIYLMTECDLSHCLYVATANSLNAISAPLLSRFRPVFFPSPGPQHAQVITRGVLRDIEKSWSLPAGALMMTPAQMAQIRGLAPREMRRAIVEMLGREACETPPLLH